MSLLCILRFREVLSDIDNLNNLVVNNGVVRRTLIWFNTFWLNNIFPQVSKIGFVQLNIPLQLFLKY